MRKDYKIISTFKACVPTALPLRKLVKENVMIVGDAARLANPALGSGIWNAVFDSSKEVFAVQYFDEVKGDIVKYKYPIS